MNLVAVHAELGEMNQARAALDDLLRARPGFTLAQVPRLVGRGWSRTSAGRGWRNGAQLTRSSTSASCSGIEKNGEWLASSVCTVHGIFACIARWLAMSIARSCRHST